MIVLITVNLGVCCGIVNRVTVMCWSCNDMYLCVVWFHMVQLLMFRGGKVEEREIFYEHKEQRERIE